MDAQVVFAALYAGAMTLAALGLDQAGRASVRQRPHAPDPAADTPTPWPHIGSIAVHTVVGAVAAVAGLLLAVVTGITHHQGGDLLLLAVPTLLAMLVLRRLYGRLRTAITR